MFGSFLLYWLSAWFVGHIYIPLSMVVDEAIDLRTPEDNNGLEPSLLIYQSDLCSAMLDHLEANFGGGFA